MTFHDKNIFQVFRVSMTCINPVLALETVFPCQVSICLNKLFITSPVIAACLYFIHVRGPWVDLAMGLVNSLSWTSTNLCDSGCIRNEVCVTFWLSVRQWTNKRYLLYPNIRNVGIYRKKQQLSQYIIYIKIKMKICRCLLSKKKLCHKMVAFEVNVAYDRNTQRCLQCNININIVF